MKQFIYLDHDIVYSVVAQKNKGVVQSFVNENQTSTENDVKTKKNESISGNLNAGIRKLANIDVDAEISTLNENGHREDVSSRLLANMILHDAMFDMAMEYMKPKDIEFDCTPFDIRIGSYVALTREFQMIDLDYFKNLFETGGLVDFAKTQEISKEEAELDKIISKMNREQRRNKSNISQMKKKITDAENEKYENALSVIKLIKNIFPYSKQLYSEDGYLILLNDKYFRLPTPNFSFCYGGEIHCVGIITNVIHLDESNTSDGDANSLGNIFKTFQKSVNATALRIYSPNKTAMYVVIPIAVYYENL